MEKVLSDKLPQHVAVIMDGNGRWAKRRFLPRPAGHKAGIKTARAIIETAATLGIKVLTLFVFSSENWRRPKLEIDTILQLFLNALTDDIKRLHENNIRLKIIGDITKFPTKIQQAIADAQSLTQNNQGMTLVLAANYGGIWDLTQAMQTLAQKIQQGELTAEAVTSSSIANHLTTAGLPDPDLFIRTSGEQRLSNFYLWQLSYAELYFTEVPWPEFTAEEFQKALTYYKERERRYGYTSEQIEGITDDA